MTEAITQAAAKAAYARRIGDEAGEAYWTERVLILSDQEQRCAAFDVLKGSPDHTRLSNA
jgi:hypothetical protein